MEKSFLQNEGGYRDGSQHENGKNNGVIIQGRHTKLHDIFVLDKYDQTKMINRQIPSYKDVGMVSCSFVCFSCVMTPCSFLFHVLIHPYLPLYFEEMIFHLYIP